MIGRRRVGAMLARRAIGVRKIEGRVTVVLATVIVSRTTGGRAMAIGILAIEALATAIASRTAGGRAMGIVGLATGVVPKTVGRVLVVRQTMALRLDAGLVEVDSAVAASSVAREVLAGQCRGLRRRGGQLLVRHIMSKVLGRWMNGSRGWNTNSMRS
ncbi:MAG TPA: hypothetical protein VGI40_16000 [Pirellulaceae bacterium]|jgi:hypothetical protein